MLKHYLEKFIRIDKCVDRGARVLVRIDINSPLASDGAILDDYRIKKHAETIKYLVDHDVAVVVIAHQGRPGEKDFVSLEKHCKVLEKYVGVRVEFVDDVIGSKAREKITSLKPGSVLLLDNVRFLSEEVVVTDMDRQVDTHLVKRLTPLFDYFIFDAFAVSHRVQPSVTGFPQVLPTCIGLVFEEELRILSELELMNVNSVLIVGGAKVKENIELIERALEKKKFNRIVVGGLTGLPFIAAKYGGTKAIFEVLRNRNLHKYIDRIKRLLNIWSDAIEIPCDIAIDLNSTRIDIDVLSVDSIAMDIGLKTIEKFKRVIEQSQTIVFSGPLGYIENDIFAKGTYTLLSYALTHSKRVILAGGHSVYVARKYGLINSVYHASTGGRAFLEALVNGYLPVFKALEISIERFWR